jgi:hypothetical protein
MAQREIVVDLFKVSSPRIFLIRMVVFLTLVGLVAFVLQNQIRSYFMANPSLNALIVAVMVIGIILTFRQVVRLFPEINWVNGFRTADPNIARTQPVLLAPMAAMLGERGSRAAISPQIMRSLTDSIATRLDETRDISRYMTGLLIFLGLLGTFWGLIETVGSIGNVIRELKSGGDAASMFDSLREGLAQPLAGMGISFSSSLFGLAGSLILGFLDLQMSQAQNRFYTELEDWLATTVRDMGAEGLVGSGAAAGASSEIRTAMERLREVIAETGSSKAATNAMANLAEAIQGLVQNMRSEQQMIRNWADAQADQHAQIKRLLEMLMRERGQQPAQPQPDREKEEV